MSEEKQRLVVDTSVCIDLFNGRIVSETVRLPYDFLLPDVILVEELKEPSGEELIRRGFIAAGTTGEEMRTVEELSKKYGRPSRNDLFALTIAKVRGLTLLGGDKDLRNSARREGVAVHGTIWILDRLIAESNIIDEIAADALERIMSSGARLPRKECTDRLRKWRMPN